MNKISIAPYQPYRRALIRCCFLSFCLPALAGAQVTQRVCKTMLPHMRRNHIPDLALASFANGEVHGFYCTTGSHPLVSDAIFEAASLSKPVFAAAVLKLVEQGKLDLDRPLAAYLPGPYRHEENPFDGGTYDTVTDPRLSRVTARMILSHTSGLPNWSRHQPLAFLADPGQMWSYSGEGYVYLQHVVETITGEPLQSFVQKAVFDPLGMAHSSFVWKPEFTGMLLAPHTLDGSQGKPEHYVHAIASSTLYTSLDDYARFVSILLDPQPDSPIAWEETKQVEVNSQIKLGWGLGVALEDTSNKAYFHWGANPGFQSFFMVQPSSRRGVLFFTDSDNGLALVDTVVADFVPGNHPALKFPMLHPKD